MRDAEQDLPRRRSRQTRDEIDEQEIEDVESEAYEYAPPPGGALKAILAGLIAGLLGAVLNVIITFLNSPLYRQAAGEAKNALSNIDFIVTGLTCLSFFINLLICFIAGFAAGRLAIQRKFGFFAGALAGVVMFLISFLTRYIPNYPGNLTSQGPANIEAFSRGIIASLVFLLIWLFLGGLLGLWGAARATRKHPYYLAQRER